MQKYVCPCCGYLTLPEESPGSLEICDVCCWQDDVVAFYEPDRVIGANPMSLNEAKKYYAAHGVVDEQMRKHARPPRPDEIPPGDDPRAKGGTT